jgi:CheY-like chemotaxis protein
MAKVLLVEDDTMNRDMISRQLSWQGFQVITAGDGRQAIAVAREERPELILMDMGLPVMSGWEATAELKADPELRRIPIIALTAFAMAEDRARSLESGCDAYETKPILFARLIDLMRRLIAAP